MNGVQSKNELETLSNESNYKLGISITDKDNNIAWLACEMDREDFWDELDDSRFCHKFNKDIKLKITSEGDSIRYTYTVNHIENYKISLVDMNTYKEIVPNMDKDKFMQSLCNSELVKVYNKQNNDTLNTFDMNILNKKIKINIIRMISMVKPTYALTFIVGN